jgi:hypothetical protein
MKTSSTPMVRTAGSIARELNQPLHRVEYILRTRPHIQPSCRAGRLRVYSSQAVAQVRHELNAIDARASHAS